MVQALTARRWTWPTGCSPAAPAGACKDGRRVKAQTPGSGWAGADGEGVMAPLVRQALDRGGVRVVAAVVAWVVALVGVRVVRRRQPRERVPRDLGDGGVELVFYPLRLCPRGPVAAGRRATQHVPVAHLVHRRGGHDDGRRARQPRVRHWGPPWGPPCGAVTSGGRGRRARPTNSRAPASPSNFPCPPRGGWHGPRRGATISILSIGR